MIHHATHNPQHAIHILTIVKGNQRLVTKDPKQAASNWQRMRFKKNKVWMAVDAKGQPVEKDGKVLIKYQLEQDYEYWVNTGNVIPLESHVTESRQFTGNIHQADPSGPATAKESMPLDEASLADKICIYTDGASSGNPGPSGIGVVLHYGEHQKEISEFIGNATNNIAELKAIETGLSALKNRDIPVRVFTDSNYAYGLLALNWKPKTNQQLVKSIKKKMHGFKDLKIIKVKGHSGHPENERADYLATSAIKRAVR